MKTDKRVGQGRDKRHLNEVNRRSGIGCLGAFILSACITIYALIKLYQAFKDV